MTGPFSEPHVLVRDRVSYVFTPFAVIVRYEPIEGVAHVFLRPSPLAAAFARAVTHLVTHLWKVGRP